MLHGQEGQSGCSCDPAGEDVQRLDAIRLAASMKLFRHTPATKYQYN